MRCIIKEKAWLGEILSIKFVDKQRGVTVNTMTSGFLFLNGVYMDLFDEEDSKIKSDFSHSQFQENTYSDDSVLYF